MAQPSLKGLFYRSGLHFGWQAPLLRRNVLQLPHGITYSLLLTVRRGQQGRPCSTDVTKHLGLCGRLSDCSRVCARPRVSRPRGGRGSGGTGGRSLRAVHGPAINNGPGLNWSVLSNITTIRSDKPRGPECFGAGGDPCSRAFNRLSIAVDMCRNRSAAPTCQPSGGTLQ